MDNEKIKLEICCGTTCYMLGAAEVLKIESVLPEVWKEKIDVCACPCMETCTRDDIGQAPFIRLNGERIGNATMDKVLGLLTDMMMKNGGVDHE